MQIVGRGKRNVWFSGLALLIIGCGETTPPGPENGNVKPPSTHTGPPVELVNKDYNRLTSIVLIRRVHRPTLANLEFAIFDSNVMREDPGTYKFTPPKKRPKLADLHFGETLVASSLTDRIEKTPLTEAERNSPMSWDPVEDHLMNWNSELSMSLLEAAPEVTDEIWGDDGGGELGPFQRVTRVYLHREADGKDTIWFRVEFRRWVKFLDGVDDEDGDGFPEIYGQVNPKLTKPEIAARLRADYRKKALSAGEIKDWWYALGSKWYPEYNTVPATWVEKRSVFEFADDLADEDNQEDIVDFPSKRTEAEVMNALKGIELKPTDLIYRGRPHLGKNLYNILLIGSP